MKGPQACFEPKPDSLTLRFGGRYISLVRVSDASGYSRSHVSRVLRGELAPSVECLKKLASALHLSGVDELLNLIEDYQQTRRTARKTA